jgi:MFS family permease
MMFTVLAVSLRQTVLPVEVLGRVNGALAALFGLMLPFGAIIAGPLAEMTGVRSALVVGLSAGVIAPIAVAFSSLSGLKEMPNLNG